MTDDRELDVEELRAELDQIKDAMGIQERYSGATEQWLLFGFAVPVAAAISQYVHLERLPAWYHTVTWAVVIAGAFGLYFALNDRDASLNWSTEGKPNLLVQFGIVYLASIPLQSIAGAYVGDLGYVEESALALAIIVVMIGVAYGVFGSSLRAHYVRRRDRWVFYVGTVWMVGLGVLIPEFPFLEEWAFAVFGGVYFAYAMLAYLWLRSGGEGG